VELVPQRVDAQRNLTEAHNVRSVGAAVELLNGGAAWGFDTADVFSDRQKKWFRLVACNAGPEARAALLAGGQRALSGRALYEVR
jgi:hypothetical protein